jgi:hypothetical protein
MQDYVRECDFGPNEPCAMIIGSPAVIRDQEIDLLISSYYPESRRGDQNAGDQPGCVVIFVLILNAKGRQHLEQKRLFGIAGVGRS